MDTMEMGPAVFAGTAFVLFGAALLLWTAVRAWQRRPVALGVLHPGLAVALAGVAGVVSVAAGVLVLVN